MTVNQAIYIVRERINQFSDDSTISNREILFELDLARAEYYHSLVKSNRYKKIPESAKQTICLPVEVIPNSQCGCVDTDCTIVRSIKHVPQVIVPNPKVAAGKYDAIPFNSVSWSRFIYSGSGPYMKNAVFASLHNDDFIYVKGKNPLHKLIECVYVTGVFENPTDAENFSDEDGPCYDKATTDYPMSAAEFSMIKEIVIKKFIGELRIPEDNVNNANDDTVNRR